MPKVIFQWRMEPRLELDCLTWAEVSPTQLRIVISPRLLAPLEG